MLAYIIGSVNEDLLRRIEYLLEENRVLRNQIQKRILLTDHERRTLAERAMALGKLMADTVTSVMALGHRPSDAGPQRGRVSFASTGKCCGQPTSLPPRVGRAGD
jgi:hypothetical protein